MSLLCGNPIRPLRSDKSGRQFYLIGQLACAEMSLARREKCFPGGCKVFPSTKHLFNKIPQVISFSASTNSLHTIAFAAGDSNNPTHTHQVLSDGVCVWILSLRWNLTPPRRSCIGNAVRALRWLENSSFSLWQRAASGEAHMREKRISNVPIQKAGVPQGLIHVGRPGFKGWNFSSRESAKNHSPRFLSCLFIISILFLCGMRRVRNARTHISSVLLFKSVVSDLSTKL